MAAAPGWGGTLISVLPVSASGGSIPGIRGSDPADAYLTWPSAPIDTAGITDGSPATFVPLEGHDGVPNAISVTVDTGTFYLLQYQIDPLAESFSISFTAEAQHPGSNGDLLLELIGAVPGVPQSIHWEQSAAQMLTFGVTFTRTGNTGNRGHAWGLDDIVQPDGVLNIVLQGGYFERLDEPGATTSRLYDVSATAVIPEPGWSSLGASLTTACLLIRRRP